MTYPMPPELLEQLGLEPCADTDPCWPEDHDALGRGWRVAAAHDELGGREPHNKRSAMVADVGELYASLSTQLARTVANRVGAPSVVIEDACQAAWTRFIFHAQRVDPQAARSWLATTAIHEAIRLARRDARELSLEARVDEDGELQVPSPAPGPEEQVEWRERLGEVSRLPIRQQRLLWSKAIGLSYREIAARQPGLTERIVERQLQRGRTNLRAAG